MQRAGLRRPRVHRRRRYGAFSPLSAHDLVLFRAILAGEHTITGFADRDLTRRLHPHPPADTAEAKRWCASTSSLVSKLRGHGLTAKIPKRRRYRPTRHGPAGTGAAPVVHAIPDAFATSIAQTRSKICSCPASSIPAGSLITPTASSPHATDRCVRSLGAGPDRETKI
jgi:hypothetical protein